jgi:hypothetical protein
MLLFALIKLLIYFIIGLTMAIIYSRRIKTTACM